VFFHHKIRKRKEENGMGNEEGVKVHAILLNKALCEFSRRNPNEWPDGHGWVAVNEFRAITCASCKTKAHNIMAELRKIRNDIKRKKLTQRIKTAHRSIT
jgi:hypothetical protein